MRYLVDTDNLKVKLVTTAKHKPKGGKYTFLESDEELKNPIVESIGGKLTLAEDPLKLKESLVTIEYNTLVKDVTDEMKKTFGTSSEAAASADAATYEAMLKRPENYVDVELELNTTAEVTAYALAELNKLDAFGLYRLKKKKKFNTRKKEILGE